MVYPDRPPPPPEDVLWAPWARSIRRAQAPRFPLSMAFVGWVCQGAAGGVFRRFTSSFQVGVEAIIGQKYFWGCRVVSELARRRAWMGARGVTVRSSARLKSHRDVTPVARSARPATAPDRPRRLQKGQLRITRTDAPPSHYPIGRIQKEKGRKRPRTRPPRGRHRAAVYSNSVSDSTSRTRSTCPEIGCLR